MISVLFVCLGNICRSPMAEALFSDLVEGKGLKGEFSADSAGIGDWHTGDLPHSGTRRVLEENQVEYHGIFARQVRGGDWSQFDYIIAMDQQTIDDLQDWPDKSGKATISRLLEHGTGEEQLDIPDPYFTNNFELVYQLVEAGTRALLDELIEEHNL